MKHIFNSILQYRVRSYLESIAYLSNLNYNRLPSLIVLPEAHIKALYNRINEFNKYDYYSKEGYIRISMNDKINKPKIIFHTTK